MLSLCSPYVLGHLAGDGTEGPVAFGSLQSEDILRVRSSTGDKGRSMAGDLPIIFGECVDVIIAVLRSKRNDGKSFCKTCSIVRSMPKRRPSHEFTLCKNSDVQKRRSTFSTPKANLSAMKKHDLVLQVSVLLPAPDWGYLRSKNLAKGKTSMPHSGDSRPAIKMRNRDSHNRNHSRKSLVLLAIMLTRRKCMWL